MPLSEAEIRTIQLLFAYPSSELYPNSYLRTQIKQVTNNDTKYNLTVINSVSAALVTIADLDNKIKIIKDGSNDAIQTLQTGNSQMTQYRVKIDAAIGLKEQRRNLINRISLDLNLLRVQHTGRKYRS